MKAVITKDGVDVLDMDGRPLTCITEQDAVHLYESLKRQMPQIRKLAKLML